MPDYNLRTDKNFFIGANTCTGFSFCAEKRLKELDRVYIIKGGPGTGKSTFLRQISERASEAGYYTEKYYCSSDSTSLDAVVIDDMSVGIVDGTAPHLYEPTYPGASENLLDIGLFWSSLLLRTQKDKITELGKQKSDCFSSAYRYLSAAAIVRSEEEALLSQCYLKDKAYAAVRRLLASSVNGNGYSVKARQVSSIGMKGNKYFDTFESLSERHISITDKRGLASAIFDELIKAAKERELELWISYDPLKRPDAIFLPELKTAVTLKEGGKPFNTERFVDVDQYGNIRQQLRFLSSIKKELFISAETELSRAEKYHFALEDIYSEAMDFLSLSDSIDEFITEELSL